MAYDYVTEIYRFVYDPLTIWVCGRGPHARGYYVHEEYDISAKSNHVAYIHENHAR